MFVIPPNSLFVACYVGITNLLSLESSLKLQVTLKPCQPCRPSYRINIPTTNMFEQRPRAVELLAQIIMQCNAPGIHRSDPSDVMPITLGSPTTLHRIRMSSRLRLTPSINRPPYFIHHLTASRHSPIVVLTIDVNYMRCDFRKRQAREDGQAIDKDVCKVPGS